jgi:hypothetical protein
MALQSFSERTLRGLKRLIRAEGERRTPDAQPLATSQQVAYVTITGAEDSGYFPANATLWNSVDEAWDDFGAVWCFAAVGAIDPDDASVEYLGLRFGDFTIGGDTRPVFVVGGAGSSTVEELDGTPAYSGITRFIFDQTDGFALSQPAANQVRIDLLPTLAVETLDTFSSYAAISKLIFDQEDGFELSQPAANQVRIDLLPAAATQIGVVDLVEDQQLGAGRKKVEGLLSSFNVSVSGAGGDTDLIVSLGDVPGTGVPPGSSPGLYLKGSGVTPESFGVLYHLGESVLTLQSRDEREASTDDRTSAYLELDCNGTTWARLRLGWNRPYTGGTVGQPHYGIYNYAILDWSDGTTTDVGDPLVTVDVVGGLVIGGSTSLASGSISDFAEAAQDAVGGILVDSGRIDLTYNDGTPSITADLISDTVTAGYLHAGATDVLFGRSSGGAGAGEEITCTSFARSLLDDADAAAALATLGIYQIATYTPSNVTTDRSYDANATTLDEIADVLGTLIADLQAAGVLA